MVTLTWVRAVLAHRRARILGTAAGVAVGVALLASIGGFLSATESKMTRRAIQRVPVDWQVQGRSGVAPSRLLAAVRHQPRVAQALPVSFADTTGFTARTGASTQTTGPGRILGLPAGYARAFPGEVRTLAGRGDGVALAQQTAANLHARPGSAVTIRPAGGRPATVRVAGVIDLPEADSLFQQVGAPPGAQPQAPPDNVVLLPQRLFDRVARRSPVTTQVHATVSHALPPSPSSAFNAVEGQARNLETRLAGDGLVGDNLGATLDKAREDALYAQILFLFLGVPGAILAALVTATVASAGATRRRRDAALLRARGASTRRLVGLALGEAGLAAALGVLVGLPGALAIGAAAFHRASFGASTLSAASWATGASLAGLLIAVVAIALPAWRDARSLTVVGARREIGRRDRAPWWTRYGVDFLCLAGAVAVYWQASRNGYQLVLAPEGVPQVSVNWYALLAPLLAWIGLGLLIYRIAEAILSRGRTRLARALRPVAGELSVTVAATMGRQRALLARSVALVALTGAFAASTAVFNSTYQQQAGVDALLTNGADVSVIESPGANVRPQDATRLASVRGVKSVEPLQHRFAYVGADLQDLYGVRPSTIGTAGNLQDAWFQGGTAAGLMRRLAQRPDSVLVAAETVHDFQLNPGDLIRLRLQDTRTKRYRAIPFHYAGVAKEFPTAPSDSFLVANADYVARQTGSASVGTFLIQTRGASPGTVAQRVRHLVGTGAQVTDVDHQRRIVGSNLTAVELTGLTKVELAFALILAVASAGLALALGLHERRRTFAIASALGAGARQLGGFVWAESAYVTIAGLLLGAIAATALSQMLVKILTGVFDPPPDSVAVPAAYLAGLLLLTIASTVVASAATLRGLRRPAIEDLRDL